MIINELLHAKKIEVYWDSHISPDQWETAAIGSSSEIAGSVLLESWEFPEEVYECVARQSDTDLLLDVAFTITQVEEVFSNLKGCS